MQDHISFEIDYLAHHADTLPTLARWHHDQWFAMTPDLTIADRVRGFQRRTNIGQIPTGFVAVLNGTVVGMACLVECDLDSHAHLTPWLATVLVAPSHRGQGVGSALCRRAAEEARALGFPRAYLFTIDKESLYGRLGWTAIESTEWRGAQITVMALDLT